MSPMRHQPNSTPSSEINSGFIPSYRGENYRKNIQRNQTTATTEQTTSPPNENVPNKKYLIFVSKSWWCFSKSRETVQTRTMENTPADAKAVIYEPDIFSRLWFKLCLVLFVVVIGVLICVVIFGIINYYNRM